MKQRHVNPSVVLGLGFVKGSGGAALVMTVISRPFASVNGVPLSTNSIVTVPALLL
jgi:hypothetical protein